MVKNVSMTNKLNIDLINHGFISDIHKKKKETGGKPPGEKLGYVSLG